MLGVPIGYNELAELTNQIAQYHHEITRKDLDLSNSDIISKVTNEFKERNLEQGLDYEPFSKQSVKRVLRENLGNTLIEEYSFSQEDFRIENIVARNGFEGASKMFRSLTKEHRDEYKQAVVKSFEQKYKESNGKVNVAEHCRKAGISTSAFYSSIREREGSMDEFRSRMSREMNQKEAPIEKIVEENYQIPSNVNRKAKKVLRAAASIGIAATLSLLPGHYASESEESYTSQEIHPVEIRTTQFTPEQPQMDFLAYR